MSEYKLQAQAVKYYKLHMEERFYKSHKRDDFNFAIINFPHHDCNIPTAPPYGVYNISQLELEVYIQTFYIVTVC
jgi:hypothetical protein